MIKDLVCCEIWGKCKILFTELVDFNFSFKDHLLGSNKTSTICPGKFKFIFYEYKLWGFS